MPPLPRPTFPRGERGPATVAAPDPTITDRRVFIGAPIPRGAATPPGQAVQVTRHDGVLSILTQGLTLELGGTRPGAGELALSFDLPMTADPAVWKRVRFQVRGSYLRHAFDASARVVVRLGKTVNTLTLRAVPPGTNPNSPTADLGSKEFAIEFGVLSPGRLPRVVVDGSPGVLLRVEVRAIVDAGRDNVVVPDDPNPEATLAIDSIDAMDVVPIPKNP